MTAIHFCCHERAARRLCKISCQKLVNVYGVLQLNESLQFFVDVKTNCSQELSAVRKGWLDNLGQSWTITCGRVQSRNDYFLIREEWGVVSCVGQITHQVSDTMPATFFISAKTEIKTLRVADGGINTCYTLYLPISAMSLWKFLSLWEEVVIFLQCWQFINYCECVARTRGRSS